jgi:predicted enzyme related to lactoylglutathione lyase
LAKEDFAAVADLKEAGVKIMYEEHVRESGRSVYFFDTEGNYLQIHTPHKR